MIVIDDTKLIYFSVPVAIAVVLWLYSSMCHIEICTSLLC